MLIRTNLYLPLPTLAFLKQKAKTEKTTMASLVRRILEKASEREGNNWAQSLLALARKAGKSELGDLSVRHDKYLYRK